MVGIDISEGMVLAARRAEMKQPLGGLAFASGSATELLTILSINEEALELRRAAGEEGVPYGMRYIRL